MTTDYQPPAIGYIAFGMILWAILMVVAYHRDRNDNDS